MGTLKKPVKFVFDLDGTITAEETLPLIAKHFKIEDEITLLTKNTLTGTIPFVESFIRRVHILGKLPIDEIDHLLYEVNLHTNVVKFINEHNEQCAIATGNLCFWIERLIGKIGCKCHCSLGIREGNIVKKLTSILKKEHVVSHYQNLGFQVVYIGDSNNDMEAMRLADVAIAVGLTHYPASSVLSITDYLVFNEEALCRQLNQLL